MKWIDLTDALFCRAFEHIFIIEKPRYRNDVVEWRCQDAENNVVAEGRSIRLTAAKDQCNDFYKKLKAERKGVFIKKNGKLKAVV